MKKTLSIAILLLVSGIGSLSASGDRASGVVDRMSAAVGALGDYAVRFEVRVGDYSADGNCSVSGASYDMTLGTVDVFCDGRTRYEVNRSRREITIDAVDTLSRNILVNPAGSFDFAGDDFDAELLPDTGEGIVVRLTPKGGGGDAAVEIAVDGDTGLPRRIAYRSEGDDVVVDILSVASSVAPPARFDASAYDGYEIIDFR